MSTLGKIGLTVVIIVGAFFLIGLLQMVYFFGRILVIFAIFGGAVSLVKLVWANDSIPEPTNEINPSRYSGGHNAPNSENTTVTPDPSSQPKEASQQNVYQQNSNTSGSYKSGDLYK